MSKFRAFDPGEGILSYAPNPDLPQCSCSCHNRELANVLAEIDVEGFHMPSREPGEPAFWRGQPRWVDRRDESEAALACKACKPLHALAYSTDPNKAWAEEQHRAHQHKPRSTKKGGPQGQCEPDCPYCLRHDSIHEDHKKKP